MSHSSAKEPVDGRSRGEHDEPNLPLAGMAARAPRACGVAAAHAQTGYPDRPVKIIVPIGPGGSYDLVGRQLADALSKRMGQAFVVENKPGAGTVVGTQAASQSEPDGYTLVVGGLSNMAFNSALYSKLGYDPLQGFRAGRADLQVRLRDGRPQGSAARQAAGHRRGRKGQSGLDFGRDRRRRHRPASGGGCLHEGRRRKIPGGALQGLAAGLHRSARRPHRPVLRFDCRGAALRAVGAGEGHRGAVVEAQPAGA